MLKTLLHIIAAGGAASVPQLARRLEVSDVLVERMLDDLVRHGYLELLGGGCPGSCSHCPVSGACLAAGRQRIWVLSRKGEGLLAAQA
jgi:predicted ArsR family transcriptional regulator